MSTDDAHAEAVADRIRRAEQELRAEARARESDLADGPRRGPKVGRGAFGLITLANRYALSDDDYPTPEEFRRVVRRRLKGELRDICQQLVASDRFDGVYTPLPLIAREMGVSRSTLVRGLREWQRSE